MQSLSRLISLILFLLTLGAFVCATPVDATAHELSERSCTVVGCNEAAVQAVLNTLKASTDTIVANLNSIVSSGGDPSSDISAVISAVSTAVAALGPITKDTSGNHGSGYATIVATVFHILTTVVVALVQFPTTPWATSVINKVGTLGLDSSFSSLIQALNATIGGTGASVGSSIEGAGLVGPFVELGLIYTLGYCGIILVG